MLSQPIVFLIDENVPDSVAAFLRERGHTVYLSREQLGKAAEDLLIAKAGQAEAAVVVTFNHKHFKQLVPRRSTGQPLRFRNLGRISLRCSAPHAPSRVAKFIDSIELHYQLALRQPDKRLIIDLGDDYFRVQA